MFRIIKGCSCNFLGRSCAASVALALLLILSSCSERQTPSEIVHGRNQSVYHKVKADETLETIATAHNIDMETLLRNNPRLKKNRRLYRGQRLLISTKTNEVDMPYYAANDDLTVRKIDPTVSSTDVTPALQSADGKNGTPQPAVQDAGAEPLVGEPQMIGEDKLLPLSDHNSLHKDGEVLQPTPSVVPQQASRSLERGQTSSDQGHYRRPVIGKILHRFGETADDGSVYKSVYIQAPVGTKVRSVLSGTVLKAGKVRELRQWGNIAMIKLSDGRVAVYGFLKEVYLKKGQQVKTNTIVGTIGKNKQQPMLVFHLREKVAGKLKPIDPLKFFGK